MSKNSYFGKSVLFTDRHDRSNEITVDAYSSQYHVEEYFKQMKNSMVFIICANKAFLLMTKLLCIHFLLCISFDPDMPLKFRI
jgi:transposase